MTRMTTDLSWNAARELSRIIAPALRDEELHDFFLEALRVCRQLLTDYVNQRDREAAMARKPLPPNGDQTP